MTIKVIKDAYYVSEDLTSIGMVNKDEFESSYTHILVVGDIWVQTSEGDFGCVKGEWKGGGSDEWWDYKGNEGYFIVIE
jgi:hypothetical protein